MRRMRLQSLAVGLVVIATAASISAPYLRSYTRAAAVFARFSHLEGPITEALAWEDEDVIVEMTTVPSRHGPLPTRVYVPRHIRRAVTLMAGVNMLGIDEPRLYGLAYEMARVGVAVITPDTPDLKRFDISARTVDMIEDSAIWLSQQRRLAPSGHVGMVGISFSGGLSIVAAGRPALRPIVDFVFSFGGHSDFPRVLRYLCTGKEPALAPVAGAEAPAYTTAAPNAYTTAPPNADTAAPPNADTAAPPNVGRGFSPGASSAPAETYRRPHDYGVVIILLDVAERVVPAGQVQPLKDAILTYLLAGHYELIDKRLAKGTFDKALAMADALPEPSRAYMRMVNDRDVEQLGRLVLPLVETHPVDRTLSPDLNPPPVCTVFLLHGTDDTVIPSIETLQMERYLRGKTRVRALLSGVITHAELDQQQGYGEVWRLVDFFAALLRQ